MLLRAARFGAPRAPRRVPRGLAEYPGRTFGREAIRRAPERDAGAGGVGAGSWALLTVPVAAFGLGVWQVKRKGQKEALIAALESRLSAPPVLLPADPAEVAELDYQHVHVTGEYDHGGEVILAPRTKLRENFDGNAGDPGAHILTPFVRSDTGRRVLVNRGWVPDELRDPSARRGDFQPTGTVTIDAIVHNPKRGKPNVFVPDNEPEKGLWFWVDLPALARHMGTDPVLIEVTDACTPASGYPLGGQTQVTVRNEHMQYIVTWFTLAAITTGMWVARVRPQLFRRAAAARR